MISEPSSLALPHPGAGSGAVSVGSTVHFAAASAGCSAEAGAAGEPGHLWQKAGASSTTALQGQSPMAKYHDGCREEQIICD